MGIFIYEESSTIRVVKGENIVRLGLSENVQVDGNIGLRLSVGFSPTTGSDNQFGAFAKTAVGEKDSKVISDLRALHHDILDLMAGKTQVVNTTSLGYPCEPKSKPTPKTEQPAPEKSEVKNS